MPAGKSPYRQPTMEWLRGIAPDDGSDTGNPVHADRVHGVFCRPDCGEHRSAPIEQRETFPGVAAALAAGYRPCLRCRPEIPRDRPPAWLPALIGHLDQHPGCRLDDGLLATLNIAREDADRWFRQHHRIPLAEWTRHRSLAVNFAARDTAAGEDVTDRMGGTSPGGAEPGGTWSLAMFPTPLGTVLAGADSGALRMLQFADRTTGRLLPGPGREGSSRENPVLDQTRAWLDGYFGGRDTGSDRPAFNAVGTPFQRRVWAALQEIPAGETRSYAQLAEAIGRPTATRAVARANATNPIALLIPCHRVVGADGGWGGYGGGLWRKRLLIGLEKTGPLPGA